MQTILLNTVSDNSGGQWFKDALHLSVIAERHCHRVTLSHKLVPDTAACAVQRKFLPSPIKLILPTNIFNSKYSAYPYPLLSQPVPLSSLTAECQL